MNTGKQHLHHQIEARARSANSGLFASPEDALKKVDSEFEYWTGKLSENSLSMCYALIGANWVIFGSSGVLHNLWAQSSVLLALLPLAMNLITASFMSESHRGIIARAEDNPPQWQHEFEESEGRSVAWPFTRAIERVGLCTRWAKLILPLMSGLALIVGTIAAH